MSVCSCIISPFFKHVYVSCNIIAELNWKTNVYFRSSINNNNVSFYLYIKKTLFGVSYKLYLLLMEALEVFMSSYICLVIAKKLHLCWYCKFILVNLSLYINYNIYIYLSCIYRYTDNGISCLKNIFDSSWLFRFR